MEKRERLDQFAFLKMELCIKGSGLLMITRKTEEEYRFGLMDQDMMDSGKMEWLMVMEDLFMLREMFMKVSGTKTKLMVMVFILTLMEADTRVNGTRINNMVMELNNGQMVRNMRANMNQE